MDLSRLQSIKDNKIKQAEEKKLQQQNNENLNKQKLDKTVEIKDQYIKDVLSKIDNIKDEELQEWIEKIVEKYYDDDYISIDTSFCFPRLDCIIDYLKQLAPNMARITCKTNEVNYPILYLNNKPILTEIKIKINEEIRTTYNKIGSTYKLNFIDPEEYLNSNGFEFSSLAITEGPISDRRYSIYSCINNIQFDIIVNALITRLKDFGCKIISAQTEDVQIRCGISYFYYNFRINIQNPLKQNEGDI